MHLGAASREFVSWGARVMRVFVRVRPWTTFGVVLATAIASITRLLTFFLPIKVILLAASPGVPRYFPFIDPTQKMPWIIGLAIGAFVAFGLTLLLEAWARRWSEGASAEVLEGANEMAILSDQHERAQSAYSGFCAASAGILFMVFGSAALLFLDRLLLFVLVSLMAVQYGLSAWLVSGQDDGVRARPAKRWVMQRYTTWLGILSALAILVGFVAIVLPFALGFEGNVLIAILSFLIARQVVGAVRDFAGEGVRLSGRREQIDALIFPDAQGPTVEARYRRNLRDVFSRERRQELARKAVHEAVAPDTPVRAHWRDSPKSFVQTLLVEVALDAENVRRMQMQIYRSTRQMYFENEAFLFQHMEPSQVFAPVRVGPWEVGPFQYQLVEFGEGRALTAAEWKEHRESVIPALLGVEPPERLVSAFCRSHRLMPDRLLEDRLLDRIEIAVDTDDEERALADFRDFRHYLAERLRALPLVIDNRDLGAATCSLSTDGEPLAMIWGRWTLEPFGGGRIIQQEKLDLQHWLPRLAEVRPALGQVHAADLELAYCARRLELRDGEGNYKAALEEVAELNRMLASRDEQGREAESAAGGSTAP